MPRSSSATAVVLACSLVAGPAAARDPSLDLQQFKPTIDMHGFVLVYDATLQPRLRAGAQVLVNGAVQPLEVQAEGVRQFGVADGLVGVDLVGVFGITDRVEVGGSVPILQLPVQSAFAEHLGATPVAWAMGDVRLEARARITALDAPVGLAANVFVNLPTGHEGALVGRGLPSGGARFIVAERFPRFHFAANVGVGVYAPASLANLEVGTEVTYGLGLGVSPIIDRLDVNLELDGSLTPGPSSAGLERFGDGPHSPLELLVGVRAHLPAGFSVYFGAGRGLSPGFGSPEFRAFGGLTWALRGPVDADGDGIGNRDDVCRTEPEDIDGFEDEDGCPEPDNDGDMVLDGADACPLVPEDPDGFQDADGCPDPDNDLDGVPDVRDLCADEAEDLDGFEDVDGCPDPDDDADGILDAVDACPRVPEDPDGFDDLDGCPEPDNDGDGIFDLADLCPLQPEAIDGVRDEDGCPDDLLAVRFGADIIVFAPIVFGPRDRLGPEADGPLGAIADLLIADPALVVSVEVHTDGSFGAKGLERSAARAGALKARLVELGADPARIEALGWGALKPRYVGDTEEASAANERVEFTVR